MSQFKALFDLPTHLICIIDANGNFVDTNSAQTSILGLDPKELIGKPVSNNVHPEDAERTFQTIGGLLKNGGVVADFRNRARHKNGSYRWINWSAGLQNGQIVAIGTDITAQVVAEEKVSFSEQQYEILFEALPALAGLSDSNANPVYVNSTWLKFFGISNLSQVTRDFIYQNIHPDDANGVLQAGIKNRSLGQSYEINFRAKRYDGVYRWHLYRSSPIKDATGKIHRWLNIATDIHEQIYAQTKIENLFMAAPACITINSGPDHVYVLSNEINNKILGTDSAVGKTAREVLGDEGGAVIPLLDNVYKTGQPVFVNEHPVKRKWEADKPGYVKYLSSVVQATRDEHGQIDGLMTFAVDVTAQVEARNELATAKTKAESANQAKTEFLANMSHEIRTPLTAVLGFSDLALDLPDLNDKARKYLDRIKSNGHLLLNLVGDILDLSKVEASGIDLRYEEIKLRTFVEDIIESMRSLARGKALNLSAKFDKEVPTTIVSDPLLVRQVLQNLIGNAIKFTEKGFVEVFVSTDNSVVHFDVIDSGAGIANSQLEKLFIPFSQGDGSLSRKHSGTGLGLALSRKLAKALGGTVLVKQTAVGEGSKFRASILSDSKKQNLDSEIRENIFVDTSLSGKILLVEDSIDNQFLIARFLENMGLQIEVANNGLEAIEKSKTKHFQVILMDIQMPLMDGYAATSELRKKGFTGRIIALTAHALSAERDRALQSGFDDYLTKPIQREALLRLLSN